MLAGIGLIESDHARSGGSWNPSWSGVAKPRILGPLLDGADYPAVPDTDHGVLDGNTSFDRAVGPMQFLPSTWREYAVHAIGKGTPDPENIFDAAAGAGRYLCASNDNLATPQGLIAAVYGYNHSLTYVANVVSAAQAYANGALPGAAAALTTLPAVVVPDVVHVSDPTPSLASPSGLPSATPTHPLPTPAPLPEPSPMPGPLPNPPAPITSSAPSDSGSPSDTDSPPVSGSPPDSGSPSATGSPSDTSSPSGTASPMVTGSPSDTASPTDVGSLAPGATSTA